MGGGLLMTENLNDYYGEWEWYPSFQMLMLREEKWESFEVWMFWYWNVWVVGSLRPPPPSTPQLRQVSPRQYWKLTVQIEIYWITGGVSVLFRKYISIFFLYQRYNSQSAVSKYLHLRPEDPLKVYSNANTWGNFIAKVNNARDGFIGEINLSVLYGVWAELVPPYEVYQPQGPQRGKRTR